MLIAVYICDGDDNANDEENDDDYAGDDGDSIIYSSSIIHKLVCVDLYGS